LNGKKRIDTVSKTTKTWAIRLTTANSKKNDNLKKKGKKVANWNNDEKNRYNDKKND